MSAVFYPLVRRLATPVLTLTVLACGGAEKEPEISPAAAWTTVQDVLKDTKDIVVLDGVKPVGLKYTGEGKPEFGDWRVEHMLSDPENYNPITSSDAGASQIHRYVFESLLYADNEPPYTQKGHIAKAYPTISEDKLTYGFELREDVKFADGKPVTSEDVLFSMKAIQAPTVAAPHQRNYYDAVKDMAVDGPYKVSFVCKEPYILNDLFLGGMSILPKHFYDPDGLLDPVSLKSLIDGSWEKGPNASRVKRFGEQFNTKFNRNMMGSGPYMVADWNADVVTGQKIMLTRSDTYWGNGVAALPPTGHMKKVVFKIINNQDAAFIELSNGTLDVNSLQPLEFKEKSWSPEFMKRFMKGIQYEGGYTYIGWNNARPPFNDKKVRQAMTYLTNRESMVRNLLFGLAETVEGPIHKFRPEYNNDLKAHLFDPAKAVALLNEAGWKDTDNDGILDKEISGKKMPLQFEFLVNSGNQLRKDIALTLQSALKDVGVKCEVRELDWSIFLEKVKKKDFDAITLGWTGGTGLAFPPDAYQIWHSSMIAENGSNYIGFRSDEVDKILVDYRKEFDMDKRIALYKRFQEILYEEQPYTFLFKRRVANAYSRRYEGVNWYPGGADMQEWWVTANARQYQ